MPKALLKQVPKDVSNEQSQSNFVDSEEGIKSESSTVQVDSPSPSRSKPICDLSEPYASVIRSIAEKRLKETAAVSKIVQSAVPGPTAGALRYDDWCSHITLSNLKNENRYINAIFIIIIDRRRTYGSSKDSMSCYGSRKQLSSVSSSNVGGEKRKVLRSKTPYSSLPPPPVKKKNLTKVVKIKYIRVEVIAILYFFPPNVY